MTARNLPSITPTETCNPLIDIWLKHILKYTGWFINIFRIKNLNISSLVQSIGLIFLSVIEECSKFLIHKKSVKNYRFELLFLTWIRKFNLQWNRMHDILKTFFIRFWFPMWSFGRENCSLSIYAKPSSLACSIQESYAFSRDPWNRPNDPKYRSE